MSDAAFTALRTPRLVVRRFRAEDSATFSAYLSDPDVARYQSWDTPFGADRAAAFVAAVRAVHPDTPGEWCQLAIEDAATGQHIGDVAVLTQADDTRLARIGFTLARGSQGHGYATEAVTAVLDYLFGARGKHRVAADCDARNVRSAALLERVGMRREAHHVSSSWWKGEWTDEDVYAVLADEWTARRQGTAAEQPAR